MGRNVKSKADKKMQGTTRDDRDPVAHLEPAPGSVRPPPDLSSDELVVWNATAVELQKLNLLSPAYAGYLESYVFWVCLQRKLFRTVADMDVEKAIAAGLIGNLDKAGRHVDRFGKKLGLNPLDAGRVKAPAGDGMRDGLDELLARRRAAG